MKKHKFIDRSKLYARAGKGGDGCVSFRREKFIPNGGPDGGDGGNGGDVVLLGCAEEDSLIRIYFSPHQRAENAGQGGGRRLHGKSGRNLVINVPCGTEVWDEAGETLVADIVEDGQEVRVARGGKGGLGNWHFKSSTHQAPRERTEGQPGEEVTLNLKLKIMSDIGLVGFPNAGKSSLITCISDAHPKVAAYPFTTLNPIMGTLVFDDYTRFKVADIPGLIEGAHEGVGLGHDFLKHIERAHFLVYVIDMAGVDTRKPEDDYRCLQHELAMHRAELAERPSIVVANKMDIPEARENLARFIEETGTTPIEVSAQTGLGVDHLRKALHQLCGKA